MHFLRPFLWIGLISLFYEVFLFSSLEAAPNQEALAKKAMKIYNKWAETKPNDKMVAIVMDANTGKVLYEEKGYMAHYPASLAKMMTLYLVFEQLKQGKMKLTDKLPVSKNAASKKPALINLVAGETISVKDAIIGSIVKSANDAATVLGEAIGKTEKKFATLMTQKARKLGMKKTFFQNASGWHDPKQISSPYDMALLGRALLRDFPQYYKFFSTKNFTYKGLSHPNKNRTCLNKIEGCDGIKTGFFTDPVGSNITASVKRGSKRIIAVVLGGRTYKYRNKKAEELIEKGFEILNKSTVKISHTEKKIKPEEPMVADSSLEEEVMEAVKISSKEKRVPKNRKPDFNVLIADLEKDLDKTFKTSSKNSPSVAPEKLDSVKEEHVFPSVPSSKPQKKNKNAKPIKTPFGKTENLPPAPEISSLSDTVPHKSFWSVQVGTFTSLQMAKKEAERLLNLYPNLLKRDLIKIAQVSKKFPIHFTGLPKEQAAYICKKLQKDKKPCVVLSSKA